MISALGSVNPSHAASAPAQPARSRPIAIVSWLLAGPGQRLAQRDEVGEGRVVEPAALVDERPALVAEVRDRARRTRSARAGA